MPVNKENPRRTAVKLLCRIESGSAYSNILLDEHFKRSKMDLQDKKFCTALFYGTLERKLTLDSLIAVNSSKPADKLSLEVRCILRTALYQLLFMDSVPESAAVNEAVKLASGGKNPAVKGYVNGLLRAFIRDGKRIPEPEGFAEKMSMLYSCPLPLVKKWIAELGEKNTESLLASSVGRPPVTIKVNTVRITPEELIKQLESEGCGAAVNKVCGDCLDLFGGSPENTKAYKQGLFHVQDISSRLCCKAVDARPGMTVLDLCAAPGGKTFTLAEDMANSGRLIACDLHENRVRLIREGALMKGLDIVEAKANNAKIFSEEMPQADRVLCDVPCSGLGVIRRKPEIKYKDLSDFDGLPDVQYEILSTSAKYVKKDGILVYSTCTVSNAENRDNVQRFLREHSDFEPAPLWNDLGKFDGEKMLTVLPAYFDSDGFFIARFRKVR
ncbi:16S rRNA (cytosine967-C5)-methyltransferase [Ruminococcus sp. YE71]|uniref:16S rRNA (cytosine(967)-C(5))-methyltransferase RsmB n=1 Tax=unclassified Ruminococcus TaxID=2608920 RepID=UPI000889F730|nr:MULTISPECIES: 16S rRNA (cytosine(967)-C(5))-methyltransferase RsmB [unclassified Ruminococcus]SDA21013.1 16S rRNA (cytosine967-C5)-methyltransferase [Ruminococcus sp. YE78]SFW33160.1 16S rRNA (cytosine967-C5)-methyltransferase [Ruminococcus sp. YE71]